MSYRVAVVGATGNVGREMLNILAERQFPISEVIPLASTRSSGKEVSFGDKNLRIQALDDYDFAGTDIALFAAGDRWLYTQEHHRQPELLDGAARCCAETDSRRGDHQARGGVDLSIDVGGRQGRNGRTVQPDQGYLRERPCGA